MLRLTTLIALFALPATCLSASVASVPASTSAPYLAPASASQAIPQGTQRVPILSPSRDLIVSDVAMAVQIEKCGSNPLLDITSLDISPFAPLVKDKPTTIEFSGYLKKDITRGSKMTVLARWNGIKLIEKTVDICESVKEFATCPIKAGNFHYKDTIDIPQFVPAGNYQISISAKSANGKDNIFCGSIKGTVQSAPTIVRP